jgi:hypothetical protein
MAGAAGHPSLASALANASETAAKTFLVTDGLYAQIANSLRQIASYDTDQAVISRLWEVR